IKKKKQNKLARLRRGVGLEGEMSKEEKQDNVIAVIQVPLKIKQSKLAAMFEGKSYTKKTSIKKKAKKKEADVEAAIIKVVSAAPKCKSPCNTELVLLTVGNEACYKGSEVECDKCAKTLSLTSQVWHCPKGDCRNHKDGYDLDTRFPVRVTLQYYQATSNGLVDSEIMSAIAHTLKSSQNQADFIGSLVIQTNPDRPTEWVEQKNNDDDDNDTSFVNVKQLLQQVFGEDWKTHFATFQEEKFDDTALQAIDKADDLTDVLHKGEDRVKFFNELVQSRTKD
ncbi:hypothetical protein RFI_24780, partial [Reticulomyxa filosa]